MRRLLLQRGNEYETMEPLVSGVGNFTSGLCCPHSAGVAEILRNPKLRPLFCTILVNGVCFGIPAAILFLIGLFLEMKRKDDSYEHGC